MLSSVRKHTLGEAASLSKKPRKRREYREHKGQADYVAHMRKRGDCLVMRMENAAIRAYGSARDVSLGMEPGAPDLVIAFRGHIIFIEMKDPKLKPGSGVRPQQSEVHRILREMGHTVFVCYGSADAIHQTETALQSLAS